MGDRKEHNMWSLLLVTYILVKIQDVKYRQVCAIASLCSAIQSRHLQQLCLLQLLRLSIIH